MNREYTRANLDRKSFLGFLFALTKGAFILVVIFEDLGLEILVKTLLKRANLVPLRFASPTYDFLIERKIKTDSSNILIPIGEILALEALDLTPTLASKDLENSSLLLLTHHLREIWFGRLEA